MKADFSTLIATSIPFRLFGQIDHTVQGVLSPTAYYVFTCVVMVGAIALFIFAGVQKTK